MISPPAPLPAGFGQFTAPRAPESECRPSLDLERLSGAT